MSKVKLISLGVGVFFAIVLLAGSFYQVDTGTTGVITRNGGVVGEVGPGLHNKWPLIDEVHVMNVRNTKHVIENIEIYSKDIQITTIRVFSANTSLDPNRTTEIFSTLGENYVDKIIYPSINKRAKEVISQYSAVDLNASRAEVSNKIMKLLKDDFEPYGILLDSIQIEDIKFTGGYEEAQANVARKTAEVVAEKQDLQKIEVQAQQNVVQAKAAAEATKASADAAKYRVEAEGDATAYAIQKRGEAESTAIKLKTEALNASNGGLIELTKAESWLRWNGQLPTTIIPGQSIPLLNTNQLMGK